MALVSVRAAANELGVSRGTLYGLVRKRAIPYVRIGDRVLLDVSKVLATLEIAPNNAEHARRPSVVGTKGRG
jgi:excisionase family DNA binding protein